MLRTSPRETRPEPIDGATDVIEADTTEAAIAKVHEHLGADARILEARRALRGGVAGFFAKEVVQLHVAPAAPAPTAPPPPSGLDVLSPVDRLLDGFDELAADPDTDGPDFVAGSEPGVVDDVDPAQAEIDFVTFLRERMQQGNVGSPTSAPDKPTHPPAEITFDAPGTGNGQDSTRLVGSGNQAGADGEDPNVAAWRAAASMLSQSPPIGSNVDDSREVRTTAPQAAAGMSAPEAPAATPEPTSNETGSHTPGPAWSAQRLLQLGMPTDLVRALRVGPEADDATWTMALAAQLAPVCGPVPTGPALVVGPRADELGDNVRGATARSDLWFEALREGRWLHLVVGGDGWRDHLRSGPRVVSWSRPEDVAEAVRCAVELGLTLGYGPMGGSVRRARPMDVAIAVRELVDQS